jgi:hypothetical protein
MKPAKDGNKQSHGDQTMRYWIIAFAAAVTAMPLAAAASATGVHAEEYCGFNPRPGSIVECGYSSLQGCENAIGKGAMCFVNPYLVLNTRRPELIAQPPIARG